jgi:PKD repeat protein
MRGVMFRKALFLAVVLVLSFSVSANLNLTKHVYGEDQSFQGYLSFDEESVDLDKEIRADVTGCGSYDRKEIILFDFLKNASIYAGGMYGYEKVGAGTTLLDIYFDETEKDYGLWLSSENGINVFNFTLDGDANPLIDIGIDGYDWRFFGTFQMWGGFMYSDDFDESYTQYIGNYDDTGYSVNPRYGSACSDFSIEPYELQSELFVKVNAVVKRIAEGGEFKAEIGSKQCVFEQEIGYDWTSVSCNISMNIPVGEEIIEKRVCVKTSQDVFRVPAVAEDPEYYFITMNPAVYGGEVDGEEISSSTLADAVDDYLDDNCDGWCVVPFRIQGNANSDLTIAPEIIFNNGGTSDKIYDIDREIIEYNLSGKLLNLIYFDDLITPPYSEDTCFLEIEFLGEEYTDYFNVSSGPNAKIEISSEFTAKDVPISFDGTSSGGGIISYSWDFGDGVNSSGAIVSHSYSDEGNYTIILTVRDANGVSDTTSMRISVLDMEEVLDNEFSSASQKISSAKSRFIGYSGTLKEFSDGMGFGALVQNSSDQFDSLRDEFELLKGSGGNLSSVRYVEIFNSLMLIKENLPEELRITNSSVYVNYKPASQYDLPSFSKIGGISVDSLADFRSEVYRYNQQSVEGSYGYYNVYVDYLNGNEDYVFVSKNFSSSGGDLVESAMGPKIFSMGCNYENASSVILCSNVGNSFSLRYAVASSNLELKASYLVPLSAYADVEILYQYECVGGNCEYGYCGDKKCFSDPILGIYEGDSENANYCPEDCGRKIPWLWYIGLVVLLLIGIFWINFYRGPGNFFDVTNAISYVLFKKRLFMIEKDRIVLRSYVVRAMREGFNEGEIRKALEKKGWRKKQLNFIFEDIKRMQGQYSGSPGRGVSKGF